MGQPPHPPDGKAAAPAAPLLTAARFVAHIRTLPEQYRAPQRCIVALAGPPGSGKSFLARDIRKAMEEAGKAHLFAILPMDGFHLDDAVLRARGHLSRKGAPHTFDTGGLAAMLGRVRNAGEDEIAIPVFDRDLEIARAGAAVIGPGVRLVLVEGNYLLLDMPPWQALHRFYDASAMISCPFDTLKDRLTKRWRSRGMDAAQIACKVTQNDLPNARLVTTHSRAASWQIVTVS